MLKENSMGTYLFDNVSVRKLMVLGIISLAVIIRLVLFMGHDCSDSVGYNDQAFRLASGTYGFHGEITGVLGLRYLVVLPVALCMKLFGVGELSSSLTMLTYSVGLFLLAYLLAIRLLGNEGAIVTLAILCFSS